jgi:ABC-type phosphate/phosphonate transport system permease subunit
MPGLVTILMWPLDVLTQAWIATVAGGFSANAATAALAAARATRAQKRTRRPSRTVLDVIEVPPPIG